MKLPCGAFHQRKWSTAALVLKNGFNAHAEPVCPDAEWRVILGTCSKLLFPKNMQVLADFLTPQNQISHWLLISLALATFKFPPSQRIS